MKMHVGVRPRLGLGGTDYGYWNKATWGIDLDVKAVHSIEGDHVGVVVGASEHRLFVLERVWAGAAGSADLLAAVKDKERFEGATVEIVDEHGHGVAEYELGVVYVAFLEHEITGDGVMLERIGLRYLDVSFSGQVRRWAVDVSLKEAQAILAALVSMAGERKGNGAYALAELLSRRGLERPCETLVAWAGETQR